MKPFASLLLCLISFSLSAQLDDYCPCMDPPKYFENSFLDSLLSSETETPQTYVSSNEPQLVLVTDNFYSEEKPQFVSVTADKPINISPSLLQIPDVANEKNLNVSPSESEASESNQSRTVIRQKRKRRMQRVKRQRKFRKYRGKCPSF